MQSGWIFIKYLPFQTTKPAPVKKKVLIVEDQFVEANDLQLMLRKAGYEVCGIARSVPIAQQMIKEEQPELVLLDIFLKGNLTGIDLARQLREENIAFVYLSANSNEEILSQAKTTEPYGFIVKPFREKDLLVTLEIAQYRHEHSLESRVRRESALIQQLREVIIGREPLDERLLQAGKILQHHIPFDCFTIVFDNAGSAAGSIISFLRIGFDEYQVLRAKELAQTVRVSPDKLAQMLTAEHENNTRLNSSWNCDDTATSPLKDLMQQKLGMKSAVSFLATLQNEGDCVFYFFSRRQHAYTKDHVTLLRFLHRELRQENLHQPFMHAAVSGLPHKKPVPAPPSANAQPGLIHFNQVIGKSHLLLNVLDQVAQVAPFDTSVLLLGETGTGKERIADCIHQLSPRKAKPFVKVNCAALPATLIESELFGHEKGSFTGATEKRIGRFAQANGGTIFLDEIGEMPIDLQVKLLRVLQEKEIEPIGGKSAVKIDVRFIAATNRNLEKEVAEGRFRLDLYYRLNVFPIELPPLRERSEDIPLLVQHFIDVYNRKAGKHITGLSDKAMQKITAYHWPGNIRELEHLVERSVVLAKTSIIEDVTLPGSQGVNGTLLKSIDENERDHIIAVLKKCNGRIWGSGGAAELLKVPPSTLKSKMKKLGIRKEFD
jgi:DNA-binding NtrC family response regulator